MAHNEAKTQDSALIEYWDIPFIFHRAMFVEEDDPHKASNIQKFARLAEGGYQYVDVKGDGNCGYYACLLGLYHIGVLPWRNVIYKEDMLTLLTKLQAYLQRNKDNLWSNCGGQHKDYDATSSGDLKSVLSFTLITRDEFEDIVENTKKKGNLSGLFSKI